MAPYVLYLNRQTMYWRFYMSEKRFTATLNPELIRQLKAEAAKQNIRVNKILEELITEYLENRKSAKK